MSTNFRRPGLGPLGRHELLRAGHHGVERSLAVPVRGANPDARTTGSAPSRSKAGSIASSVVRVPFADVGGGTMSGAHQGRLGDPQHEPDEAADPRDMPDEAADARDMAERVAAVVRAFHAMREGRHLPDPLPTIAPPARTPGVAQ